MEEERTPFEVGSAFAMGILLPALETMCRGLAEWAVDFTTMFEDHVAGALLLVGAWAAGDRDRRWGAPFLLGAWAYVTGMMSSSFWYPTRGDGARDGHGAARCAGRQEHVVGNLRRLPGPRVSSGAAGAKRIATLSTPALNPTETDSGAVPRQLVSDPKCGFPQLRFGMTCFGISLAAARAMRCFLEFQPACTPEMQSAYLGGSFRLAGRSDR